MAKQMVFMDAAGVEHSESYWRPAALTVDLVAGQADIYFVGYHSAATRLEHLVPVPGAAHHYRIEGEQFVTLYTRHLQGENLAALAYEVATTTLDMTDANGNPVSFFAGATDT